MYLLFPAKNFNSIESSASKRKREMRRTSGSSVSIMWKTPWKPSFIRSAWCLGDIQPERSVFRERKFRIPLDFASTSPKLIVIWLESEVFIAILYIFPQAEGLSKILHKSTRVFYGARAISLNYFEMSRSSYHVIGKQGIYTGFIKHNADCLQWKCTYISSNISKRKVRKEVGHGLIYQIGDIMVS